MRQVSSPSASSCVTGTAIVAVLALGLALFSLPSAASVAAPPVAPVRNVVDTHWGVKVDDPYRLWRTRRPEVRPGSGGRPYAIPLDRIPERELLARIGELTPASPTASGT